MAQKKKFIRVRGRVVPIREKAATAAAGVSVASAGVGGYSAYKTMKHASKAAKQFEVAVAAKRLGPKANFAYDLAKGFARRHAKEVVKHSKIGAAALAVAGIAGVIAGTLSRGKKNGRK